MNTRNRPRYHTLVRPCSSVKAARGGGQEDSTPARARSKDNGRTNKTKNARSIAASEPGPKGDSKTISGMSPRAHHDTLNRRMVAQEIEFKTTTLRVFGDLSTTREILEHCARRNVGAPQLQTCICMVFCFPEPQEPWPRAPALPGTSDRAKKLRRYYVNPASEESPRRRPRRRRACRPTCGSRAGSCASSGRAARRPAPASVRRTACGTRACKGTA
mmetsp:Transcript_43043/g.115712  ORF Transcript_43043/g.115712 Transcript_43043/m.115712 type:complete len:217 (-) Transcript_43043:50-700(-)